MAEREVGSRVAAVVLAVAVLVVVVVVALDDPATPMSSPTPAGATATSGTTTSPTTDPVLPRRPDGFGEVRSTPPELVDRRRTAPDVLPPPASGQYEASIAPVWRRPTPTAPGDDPA